MSKPKPQTLSLDDILAQEDATAEEGVERIDLSEFQPIETATKVKPVILTDGTTRNTCESFWRKTRRLNKEARPVAKWEEVEFWAAKNAAGAEIWFTPTHWILAP